MSAVTIMVGQLKKEQWWGKILETARGGTDFLEKEVAQACCAQHSVLLIYKLINSRNLTPVQAALLL